MTSLRVLIACETSGIAGRGSNGAARLVRMTEMAA